VSPGRVLVFGLLLGVSAQAEEALDAEFLEFLGALESEESWEAFFDNLAPATIGDAPEPVVARPEEEDDDAG
jgi:hypothetical protein